MSTEPYEPDPRWEWTKVASFDGRISRVVRGHCKHLEIVPVETAGVVVAGLCTTCDAQLPPPTSPGDTATES